MNIKSRLQKLEAKRGENAPFVVRVYYHDQEKGYSEKSGGPYFGTFDELATAQGWVTTESDVNIKVVYASQDKISDNGRGDVLP
jgi:hypothetical protein